MTLVYVNFAALGFALEVPSVTNDMPPVDSPLNVLDECLEPYNRLEYMGEDSMNRLMSDLEEALRDKPAETTYPSATVGQAGWLFVLISLQQL